MVLFFLCREKTFFQFPFYLSTQETKPIAMHQYKLENAPEAQWIYSGMISIWSYLMKLFYLVLPEKACRVSTHG
jgi:uncharacterized membrane protein